MVNNIAINCVAVKPICSLEEFIHGDAVKASYSEWKRDLKTRLDYTGKPPLLPNIQGIQLTDFVNVDDVFNHGDQLANSRQYYKALYVYHFLHSEYHRRRNAAGMAKCVRWMQSVVWAMNIHQLTAVFQRTVEDVATMLIDDLPISNDEKLHQKAVCFYEMGKLFVWLKDHETAIREFRECIRVINKTEYRKKYKIYGDACFGIGFAFKETFLFDKALHWHNEALSAYVEATDFLIEGNKSAEDVKQAKIRAVTDVRNSILKSNKIF